MPCCGGQEDEEAEAAEGRRRRWQPVVVAVVVVAVVVERRARHFRMGGRDTATVAAVPCRNRSIAGFLLGDRERGGGRSVCAARERDGCVPKEGRVAFQDVLRCGPV